MQTSSSQTNVKKKRAMASEDATDQKAAARREKYMTGVTDLITLRKQKAVELSGSYAMLGEEYGKVFTEGVY